VAIKTNEVLTLLLDHSAYDFIEERSPDRSSWFDIAKVDSTVEITGLSYIIIIIK
jgi:hypothetical protein